LFLLALLSDVIPCCYWTMVAKIPFVAHEFYHIFNRANSQADKLFFQERNYCFFLDKWNEYLGSLVEVWAYCLVPSHFHFLVRIIDGDDKKIREQMRRFAISYAQAINKQERRRGSLFQEHLKCVLIEKKAHLLWLVYYIHNNPVHHGVVSSFWDWKYSSLQALSNNMPTKLERTKVLQLFGGKQAMLEFHKQNLNVKDIGYSLLDGREG